MSAKKKRQRRGPGMGSDKDPKSSVPVCALHGHKFFLRDCQSNDSYPPVSTDADIRTHRTIWLSGIPSSDICAHLCNQWPKQYSPKFPTSGFFATDGTDYTDNSQSRRPPTFRDPASARPATRRAIRRCGANLPSPRNENVRAPAPRRVWPWPPRPRRLGSAHACSSGRPPTCRRAKTCCSARGSMNGWRG